MLLFFVLPCAMILCFVLQCYAKYLKRHDDQAFEAFRLRAQERRLMLQQQRMGGAVGSNPSDSATTESTNKFKNVKFSDVFLIQTVTKHNECSILQKSKTKKVKQDNTPTMREPDGIKREDCCDESDLELCVSNKRGNANCSSHSCRSVNKILDKLVLGASCSAHKSDTISAAKNHPSITFDDQETLPSSKSQEEETTTESEEICCVCLDGYSEGDIICTPKQEDCDHVFHRECIHEWIKQNHDCCPLCRVVLIG